MMTKQHYQMFADMLTQISDDNTRKQFIAKCESVFMRDNPRFSCMTGESLKGLRPSRNYKEATL